MSAEDSRVDLQPSAFSGEKLKGLVKELLREIPHKESSLFSSGTPLLIGQRSRRSLGLKVSYFPFSALALGRLAVGQRSASCWATWMAMWQCGCDVT
jgi:hypothetical protein